MIQLIYASAAVQPFTPQDLHDLLLKVRPKNELHEITGMLLYDEGSFLEVLEGYDADVHFIFLRIAGDPRHANAQVLECIPVACREFKDWSMGFIDHSHSLRPCMGMVDYRMALMRLSGGMTMAKRYLRLFQQGQCRQTL